MKILYLFHSGTTNLFYEQNVTVIISPYAEEYKPAFPSVLLRKILFQLYYIPEKEAFMSEKKNTKIPPIENPELEAVISSLKGGSTIDKQSEFRDALKKAQLLAPCDFDVPIKEGEKAHPSQIKFYLVHTKDGKTFFPAFTKVSNSQKFQFEKAARPKLVVRKVTDYVPLVMDERTKAAGIVINPGVDNIVVPKGLITELAGIHLQSTPAGTVPLNITFGEPAVYPTKMVNAVYDRCEETPEIKRVWLKGKFTGSAMSFYLVVDTDRKEENVLNRIREVAIPLSKNVPVEVVFYSPDMDEKVIKGAVPLYDSTLVL